MGNVESLFPSSNIRWKKDGLRVDKYYQFFIPKLREIMVQGLELSLSPNKKSGSHVCV